MKQYLHTLKRNLVIFLLMIGTDGDRLKGESSTDMLQRLLLDLLGKEIGDQNNGHP